MKVYFISILVSCTLADYSDPYPASGFRPSGPVFELPKRLANLRGTQQYGASNREYDPAKSNVNNEYSYRTINLPQNQYGLQRDQSGGGISQTRYGQTSKNTNEPHSPSYNSPRTENRLITQQQLPMFRNSNFFQQQQLLPTQYGASNYNQFDTTASGSGKSETGNYAVNNGYAKQQSGENLKSQFSNQYDAADASKRHQQNRPGSFYNSDGIDSRTSDVDLRFGSNEFNATSNNQNGFNGNAFGNRNRDRYYNTNPTVRSREEPTTIQPEPNNDSDNDYNDDANGNDGQNVAVSTAVAGGQYYVLQPDGRLQKVTFKTTPNDNNKSGFTANLVYENVEPIRDPIYTYDQNLVLTRVNK